MAAPTIPAANSQAVLTVQAGGTIPFAQQWWNFFSNLLTYITTGPIGPVPLVGITDGSSAAAGNVGEYLSSLILTSPGAAITNNVGITLTSLVLTPGDWDVWGSAYFKASGGTSPVIFFMAISINNTAANPSPANTTFPADGGSTACDFSELNNVNSSFVNGSLGPMRINVTTNTTYFLSGLIQFSNSGGTTTAVYGCAMRARRKR